MEPINWLLFAVFIVIVVYKLLRQYVDGRKTGKTTDGR